jgi:integrase/recombinase XerC
MACCGTSRAVLQTADLALATRRGYAADLGRFRAWIEKGHGEAVRMRRITTADLASYRQYLIRSEKLRAASVNRKVQALKKFFGWAQHKKLIPANPAASLRFLRRQERARPKGLREEDALLRAAGRTGRGLARRNYALLQLLLQTGLRVGEVGWGSPIAKSTIGRGWCACTPAKAVRNARSP